MSDRSGLNTSLQDDASRIIRNSFGNGANGGLSTVEVFNKPPAQTTDRTVPRVDVQTNNDRTADPERFRSAIKNGVMELTYGDPDFDAKLRSRDYHTLKLKGLPEKMQPAPWVDGDGKGYFFWFKHQDDKINPNLSDRTRHYFPTNLKKLEIERQVGHHFKPENVDVDEMRIAATQVFMKNQNKTGFASYGEGTSALKYAQRMGEVSLEALTYQEKLLREAADTSPKNPYFRIYLSDVLAGQAAQPIIDGMMNNRPVRWDNPDTIRKLDEAIVEIQKAQRIIQTYGDFRVPVTQETPPSPFMWGNSDYYWSGASYQAYRREVQLQMLKGLARLGQIPIELPPALPPR
jgi:hypothetical protein